MCRFSQTDTGQTRHHAALREEYPAPPSSQARAQARQREAVNDDRPQNPDRIDQANPTEVANDGLFHPGFGQPGRER